MSGSIGGSENDMTFSPMKIESKFGESISKISSTKALELLKLNTSPENTAVNDTGDRVIPNSREADTSKLNAISPKSGINKQFKMNIQSMGNASPKSDRSYPA